MNDAWEDEWKTIREIEDPFADGYCSDILDSVAARTCEVPPQPDQIVYRGIVVLKRLAAQYVEDLDQLTADVARIWSSVEGHHHTSRLKAFHITEEERDRDYLLEQMEKGWLLGKDLSPIRDRRPNLWAAWEEHLPLVEERYGNIREIWEENRQKRTLEVAPEPAVEG